MLGLERAQLAVLHSDSFFFTDMFTRLCYPCSQHCYRQQTYTYQISQEEIDVALGPACANSQLIQATDTPRVGRLPALVALLRRPLRFLPPR